MVSRPHLLLLTAVLILTDAAIFLVLTSTTHASTSVSRLLSLCSGLILLPVLERSLAVPGGRRYPPGLWPLVIVALILGYGIFVALAARSPHVQPLVHLTVSWLGALLFGVFGWWRIRHWRD